MLSPKAYQRLPRDKMQVPLPQQRGSSLMLNSWLSNRAKSLSPHERPHGGETAIHGNRLPRQEQGQAKVAMMAPVKKDAVPNGMRVHHES